MPSTSLPAIPASASASIGSRSRRATPSGRRADRRRAGELQHPDLGRCRPGPGLRRPAQADARPEHGRETGGGRGHQLAVGGHQPPAQLPRQLDADDRVLGEQDVEVAAGAATTTWCRPPPAGWRNGARRAAGPARPRSSRGRGRPAAPGPLRPAPRPGPTPPGTSSRPARPPGRSRRPARGARAGAGRPRPPAPRPAGCGRTGSPGVAARAPPHVRPPSSPHRESPRTDRRPRERRRPGAAPQRSPRSGAASSTAVSGAVGRAAAAAELGRLGSADPPRVLAATRPRVAGAGLGDGGADGGHDPVGRLVDVLVLGHPKRRADRRVDREPEPVARLVARGLDPLAAPDADGHDGHPAPLGQAGGAGLAGPGLEVAGDAALREDPDTLARPELRLGGGEGRPGVLAPPLHRNVTQRA